MAMRYNNSFDFVTPFLDECCVWDNLLHTELIKVWKHDPCIYQYVTVIVPYEHAIHADFSKATYWKDSERWTIQSFIKLLHLSLD